MVPVTEHKATFSCYVTKLLKLRTGPSLRKTSGNYCNQEAFYKSTWTHHSLHATRKTSSGFKVRILRLKFFTHKLFLSCSSCSSSSFCEFSPHHSFNWYLYHSAVFYRPSKEKDAVLKLSNQRPPPPDWINLMVVVCFCFNLMFYNWRDLPPDRSQQTKSLFFFSATLRLPV